MKNSPHLSFEKIADLVEARLASEAQARALAHLVDCDDCARRRARLERAVELMRDDRSEAAPEMAISRAVALLRLRKADPPSRVKRWLAALSFDSMQMTPAFGLRAGGSVERQLLFTAGEHQIHLQVSPSGEDWVVAGQVLGPCAGGGVEARGAAGVTEAELNDSCEFTLAALAEGEYTLIVRLPEAELEIPGLRLGA